MKRSIVVALMAFVFAVGIEAADKKAPTPRFTFDIYSVQFPDFIDVSVCAAAGTTLKWSSHVLEVETISGSFSVVWSPNEPNTLVCAGALTATDFSAYIYCATNTQLAGIITATGPGNNTYTGTYMFNGATGPVTIARTSIGDDHDEPVLRNPSLVPNPAKIGETVTFKGEIDGEHVPDSATATFTWGDGSAPETYPASFISKFKSIGLTHVYQSAGVFNIHIEFQSNIPGEDGGDDFDIFEVVGDASASVNAANGASVIAEVGSGGVVSLTINAQTIFNAANASTIFEDSDGMARTKRSSPMMGFNVQQPLGASGLYVATTDILDAQGNKVGKVRKTVGIGKKIAGESDGLDDPSDTKLGIKGIKGKFYFDAAKPDDVQFSGSFKLPAGFSLTLPGADEMEFSIGNVVDTVKIDPKKKSGVGMRGRIKKLKLTLPKFKTGVAVGGEPAKITATLSTANMTGAGFDTEGITASRSANEKGAKAVTRFIQLNMLFSGVSYEVLAPVNFAVSKDSAFGSIQGRN